MLHRLKNSLGDDEKGFTLVEILVVILIIGILAAIAIPLFLNQRKEANAAALRSDLRNIAFSVEEHFADNPTDADVDFPEIPDFKASVGTTYALRGNANNWCVVGIHSNSPYNSYSSASTGLVYDSANGGLKPPGTGWGTCGLDAANSNTWSWKYS